MAKPPICKPDDWLILFYCGTCGTGTIVDVMTLCTECGVALCSLCVEIKNHKPYCVDCAGIMEGEEDESDCQGQQA